MSANAKMPLGLYTNRKMTVGQIVEEKAKLNNDKVLATFIGERTVTYRQFHEDSNRVANSLQSMGISKGDKVAVMFPNCAEFLFAWHGIIKLGAIEIPLNKAYRGDILSYVLDNSDAKIIFIDESFLDRLVFIKDTLRNIRTVIVRGNFRAFENAFEGKFKLMGFDELLQASDKTPEADVKWNDLSTIMYTSGTTGPSKGVMITHNFNIWEGEETCRLLGYTSEDVLQNYFPLSHAACKYYGFMAALLADASIVIKDRFSVTTFWDEMREYRCTSIMYMGAFIQMLWNASPKANDAGNPVRVASGSSAPAAIIREFEKRFGLKMYEVYGSTELSVVARDPAGATAKIGSIGKVADGYDLRILDENDEEVPRGQVGEICVRPLRPHIMLEGYYKMPEKTLEAYRNLWFHQGDSGYMDEDGYLYFKDRTRDCIRRRGENISSFEVEKVINSHPAVAESAAIPVKSALTEDEVMVLVVLKEDQALTPEQLLEYCEVRMSSFAVPRYVEFRDALPKNLSERVEKYKLKEQGVTEKTWDREKAGYKVKR